MVDYYPADKVNETAHGAVTAAGGVVRVTRYPAGNLLIKENFNARKKLAGVTAMLKLPHYDGADRNWVMAAYSDQGKPLAFGKARSCIQCHMVAQKQDFLFAPPTHQPAARRLFPGSENITRLSPLAPGTPRSRAGKGPGSGHGSFLKSVSLPGLGATPGSPGSLATGISCPDIPRAA